ncbi:MAG: HD domain-containing protein [Gemmatimonadaceae bacterium]|jgi:hypothetical protein|nr:HD domain-containing protein [Gemmatimonadaceae bacterium]
MRGYSDRVNHALAFAAKHHDRQVRQGTAAPYATHPANVALILTRYDQSEDVVVAGILHDVVADSVRDGLTHEDLVERIGRKWGSTVLDDVLAVTRRRTDDDGVELGKDEQHDDLLGRLAQASGGARWVCAADAVHGAGSLLADVRRTIEPATVWGRVSGGRDAAVARYRATLDRLQAVGFDAPIVEELAELVDALAGAPV